MSDPYRPPGEPYPGGQPPSSYRQPPGPAQPAPGYPPAFPPPYYGGYPVPPREGNGPAIAALVLGIIGVVLIAPLGIGALICGFLGLSKANRGASGKGQAIAGIILGAIGTLITIGIVIVIITTAASSS